MRLGGIAVLSLALLASCGQQPASTGTTTTAAAPSAVDLFKEFTAENWAVYHGTRDENKFTIQEGGSVAAQRSGHPVTAGDNYIAEMKIVADAAGVGRLRLNGSCGNATPSDQRIVTVNITPGENTLRARYIFQNAAGCPRVTLTAQSPLSFTLRDARLVLMN